MNLLAGIAAVMLCISCVGAQDNQSDFCASRTSKAYHSPKCNWGWVVHDPKRVENVNIPHHPAYHTYSRWVLDGRAYVLAYRDIDRSPEDVAADIYLVQKEYELVGTVEHLGEIVRGVSLEKLTNGILPDLVFREDCGQLQCLVVVRFSHIGAKQVFRYGASRIDVLSEPKPVIIATSKLANRVEQFAWDTQAGEFRKITKANTAR